MPCKLIKESFDPAVCVDKRTNIFKDDTPALKGILNDSATVADWRLLLDLPFIKVEASRRKRKQARSSRR